MEIFGENIRAIVVHDEDVDHDRDESDIAFGWTISAILVYSADVDLAQFQEATDAGAGPPIPHHPPKSP